MVNLVRGLGYRPDVGDLDEHGAELLSGGPPSGPQVLIVDAWAARQCACRDLLRRLDAMNKPWVQLLIPWNRQDEENAAPGRPFSTAPRANSGGARPGRRATGRPGRT